MYRATTPRHEFIFTDDPDTFAKMKISYEQNGRLVIEKAKEDMTFETIVEESGTKYLGWLRLTQEETNAFDTRASAKVQIRVLTTSGNAYASDIFAVNVARVIDDEILEADA